MKRYTRFNYIKKLINSTDDIKTLVDGQFYYNEKAVSYVNRIDKNYFMNSYYNLTNLDFLLMIDEANNLKEVKNNLLSQYQEDYAKVVYGAFIYSLERDLKEVF